MRSTCPQLLVLIGKVGSMNASDRASAGSFNAKIPEKRYERDALCDFLGDNQEINKNKSA